MIIHNQLRKPNENSFPLSISLIPPKNAEPQMLKNMMGKKERKTKLTKNNQSAFGSSCFIIYKLDSKWKNRPTSHNYHNTDNYKNFFPFPTWCSGRDLNSQGLAAKGF
jgi:hypothetical protein